MTALSDARLTELAEYANSALAYTADDVPKRAEWAALLSELIALRATVERVNALMPGRRTWAESLSRMHDGSMFPQMIDSEKVAAALGLTAGQEGENDGL